MCKDAAVPEARKGGDAPAGFGITQIVLPFAGTEHTVAPQQIFHLRTLIRLQPVIRIPEVQPAAEVAVIQGIFFSGFYLVTLHKDIRKHLPD